MLIKFNVYSACCADWYIKTMRGTIPWDFSEICWTAMLVEEYQSSTWAVRWTVWTSYKEAYDIASQVALVWEGFSSLCIDWKPSQNFENIVPLSCWQQQWLAFFTVYWNREKMLVRCTARTTRFRVMLLLIRFLIYRNLTLNLLYSLSAYFCLISSDHPLYYKLLFSRLQPILYWIIECPA